MNDSTINITGGLFETSPYKHQIKVAKDKLNQIQDEFLDDLTRYKQKNHKKPNQKYIDTCAAAHAVDINKLCENNGFIDPAWQSKYQDGFDISDELNDDSINTENIYKVSQRPLNKDSILFEDEFVTPVKAKLFVKITSQLLQHLQTMLQNSPQSQSQN